MSRDPVVWWSFAAAFVFMVAWCWRPTCSPTACAMPSIPRAAACRARVVAQRGPLTQDKDLDHAAPSRPQGRLDSRCRCRPGARHRRPAPDLQRGETFALVGESGCGKSMTALALMRLLPDNGASPPGGWVDGQDICWTCPSGRCAACAAGASA
jgi:hypothetical protein